MPPFRAGISSGISTAASAPPRRLATAAAATAVVTVRDQSCPSVREARRETSTWPRPRLAKTETKSITEISAAARPTSAAGRVRAASTQKTKPKPIVTAVVPMM